MRGKRDHSRPRALRAGSTDAEQTLWFRLRDRRLNGWKFRRQMPIGPYFVDFVCVEAQLVVELDGSQHLERIEYDNRRTDELAVMGYRVMRVWNDDVLLRLDSVLEGILQLLARYPCLVEGRTE